MKYIKLFMLMVAASLFVACSDDDDSVNTNSTTIGFESDTITVKESSGIFSVPIAVSGYRNGDIKVSVTAEAVGDNPAKEDVNYMITDKTLSLLNDTTGTETMNVQVKPIDDSEINLNRTFKLTIASTEGATVTKQSVVIVIRDNDAAFYEKFFGKWTLSYDVYDGKTVSNESKTVVISGATNESDSKYNNLLDASCTGMFNVGITLDCAWSFRYSFDATNKTGKLGLIMGDIVASYKSSYQWTFLTYDGTNYTEDDYTADWKLGDGDAFPTTFTFPKDNVQVVYLYQPGAGWWIQTFNWVLTKQ